MSNYYQSYPPPPKNQSHPTGPPPPQQQQRGQSGPGGYRDRGQEMPQPHMGGRGGGQPPRQPTHQLHHQQQLPPLRQPEPPTLNLNRDFTSAEELLKTLQQFNQSCDIFNNFEIPSASYPEDNSHSGDNTTGGAGSVGYNNPELNFQRINGPTGGVEAPPRHPQQQQQQQRHQLQNNYFTPEQIEFLRPALKLPQGNHVPPEVLALILKTQGADQVINSFGGNNGEVGERAGYPQSYHHQQQSSGVQQQMNPPQGSWGAIANQSPRQNGSRPNDFTSPSALGTSSWGPPPGAQAYSSANTSPRPDQFSSPRSQSQSEPSNSPRNYNSGSSTPNSTGQGQEVRMSKPQTQWAPSPYATEFIPKPQTSPESAISTEALALAIAQLNFPDQQQQQQHEYRQEVYDPQNSYQHKGEGDSFCAEELSEANEEFVLETVSDCINRLCASPAEFTRCVRDTTDVLNQYLGNVDTLGIVITLIIEQSIVTPNFRYSAARLCQAFHQNGVKVGESTFKKVLLQRCEEEFTKCISQENPDSESDKRAQGFLNFLGELFVNFQMVVNNKKKPIGVIGQATVELMIFLVQFEKQSFENIKCVAQVLKLLGWEFEHSENQSVRTQMEALMKDLSYILAMSSDSRAKAVIENLVELKKRDWDKTEESVEVSQESSEQSPRNNNSYGGEASGPVFYELPDSDDDDDGIDERYLVLDDEPEDVCRFYEEFLAEAEAKRKN